MNTHSHYLAMMARVSLARIFLVFSLLCALPVMAGPLHDAAKKGDFNQVKRLIEAGADVNGTDKVGRTPLHWATEKGHPTVARLLIEKGAEVDTKERRGHYYRRTPLHLAAEDLSKCLVSFCKIAPGLSEGKKAIVTMLIKRGADVNAESRFGSTALMSAAGCNAVDVAQLLIDHGADMDHRGNQYTALEMASHRGPDVAILMVKRGAKVNTSDRHTKETPLHTAAGCGFRELAEQLLLHGADVNAKNQFRDTPLHKAAGRGQRAVVELLLLHGADVDAKDKDGHTPLHTAAGWVHAGVVDALLANGAQVNARDRRGRTALFYAVQSSRAAAVELLLSKGADINVKDHGGKTPIDLATDPKILELLKERT